MKPRDFSVYLVTDRPLCRGRELLDVIAKAVAGGTTMVQLREKDADAREFYELAKAAKTLLDRANVPLIINDRVDVALAVDADGVHVGQSDLPFAEVRRLMGPDKIIGLSVDTLEQALAVPDDETLPGGRMLGPDYLGVGPVFATATKADAAPVWGVERFAELRGQTRQRLVAIGGVTVENAAAVVQAGADGVAVVSAVCSAESPEAAAHALARVVMQNRSSGLALEGGAKDAPIQ